MYTMYIKNTTEKKCWSVQYLFSAILSYFWYEWLRALRFLTWMRDLYHQLTIHTATMPADVLHNWPLKDCSLVSPGVCCKPKNTTTSGLQSQSAPRCKLKLVQVCEYSSTSSYYTHLARKSDSCWEFHSIIYLSWVQSTFTRARIEVSTKTEVDAWKKSTQSLLREKWMSSTGP